MVLYKRKQVQVILPSEIPDDLSTEVWFIPETKEWFLEYEDYLARMDYYQRRKFVCEITGNSCLTFFEALKSEIKEVRDVEKNFPEALKTHILRFLQFNRITRLDQLVDKVYLQFKNNYFPGEYILLRGVPVGGGTGEISAMKHRAVIREKVEFSNSPAKYLVVRLNDNQDTIVTGDKLSRDRNHFTKWLIKTFIKLTMTRSHKISAPWVVKDKYAKRYRIDQNYPPDLQQFKASTVSYDDPDDSDPNLMRHFGVIYPPPKQEQTLMKFQEEQLSARKLQKQLASLQSAPPEILPKITVASTLNPASDSIHEMKIKKFPLHYLPLHLRHIANIEEEGVNCNRPGTIATLQANGIPPTKKNIIDDLQIKFDLQHTKPAPLKFKVPSNAKDWNQHLLKLINKKEAIKKEESTDPNTESNKEEEEQEDNEEKEDEDDDNDDEDEYEYDDLGDDLMAIDKGLLHLDHLYNIEQALESWVFLNIYHLPLKIDTFTFDDFIYAMGWNAKQFAKQGRCQLLDEVWCSVLGAIVSNKLPSASESRSLDEDDVYGLKVNMPTTESYINPVKGEDDELIKGSESESDNKKSFSDGEDEDSDSDSNEKTKINNSSNGNNIKVKVKEEEDDADDEGDSDMNEDSGPDEENDDQEEGDDNEPREHNAYQIMNHRGTSWHDRLRKRNFREGNWQTIVLGVLSMVEDVPKYKSIVERVYRILAPLSEPATASTALNQFYERMDINLRLEVLNIFCSLLATSDMVRSYIDKSLDDSTALRRKRLDSIKEFKIAVDKAQRLHYDILDKFLQLSGNTENIEDARKKYRFDLNLKEVSDVESELASQHPDFREMCDERKELYLKLEEMKKEKKSIERQLVELDCQRVRCLGKDRLFNRYWWFENNGLPTLHGSSNGDEDNEDEKIDDDNDSSDEVQEETYMMGKLWIQGPSADDVKLYFQTSDSNSFHSDEVPSGIKRKRCFNDNIVDYDGNPVQELDFGHLPSDFVKFSQEVGHLNFKHDAIKRPDGFTVVDNLGELSPTLNYSLLTPTERKIIEEVPDPLLDGSQWRYYDNKEDIEILIKWLNPYGTRESQLKKELLNVKDAIVYSIEARNKALSNKENLDKQSEIKNIISVVEEKIQNYHEKSELNEDDEDPDLDSEEITVGRKRPLRENTRINKRKKKSTEEVLSSGTINELTSLKDELMHQLVEIEEEKESARALEWVNSIAIDEFEKSLYDGGDKQKAKGKGRK